MTQAVIYRPIILTCNGDRIGKVQSVGIDPDISLQFLPGDHQQIFGMLIAFYKRRFPAKNKIHFLEIEIDNPNFSITGEQSWEIRFPDKSGFHFLGVPFFKHECPDCGKKWDSGVKADRCESCGQWHISRLFVRCDIEKCTYEVMV